jgi:hypothetical protein
MSKEKYLANVDRILTEVLRSNSKDVGSKDKIIYSEELPAKGFFQKVAFDVYKVDNDPYSDLWVLQDVGGTPYLVRASNPQYSTRELGDWSATSDYDKNNVTLAYKNVPVSRFSSKVYGFSPEDIITFKSALLESVSGDDNFVKDILKSEPEKKRESLASKFPELSKFI